jgi:hypothetical protein
MSTPAYPDQLPIPLTFRLQANDQIVTDPENEPRDSRRLTIVPSAVADVTFRYLLDNYKIFKNWYKDDLRYGIKWFTIDLPSAAGLVSHVVRFADRPRASLKGHRYWEVSAQIEIRERQF